VFTPNEFVKEIHHIESANLTNNLTSNWLKVDPYCLRKNVAEESSFGQYMVYGDIRRDYREQER